VVTAAQKRPLGAVRLELVLDELKMSQSELARRIDSGQSTINKIIGGETRNSTYLNPLPGVFGRIRTG
jgi:plasmid maintenance system antidote protein VapI